MIQHNLENVEAQAEKDKMQYETNLTGLQNQHKSKLVNLGNNCIDTFVEDVEQMPVAERCLCIDTMNAYDHETALKVFVSHCQRVFREREDYILSYIGARV